jgi:hypothetical protein
VDGRVELEASEAAESYAAHEGQHSQKRIGLPLCHKPTNALLQDVSADSWLLLDKLVGASEERGWNSQPERLSGLEIDDRRELRRALDWKVRWPRAFENLVDEDRGAPIHLW